jgi:hypothetical protein
MKTYRSRNYGDKDYFTTNGDNGPCGHRHKTADSAAKCLEGNPHSIVIRNGSTAMFQYDDGRWEPLSTAVSH